MRKKQNFTFDRLTMGTCYYPEHWGESMWEDDLRRMKDAGISVIRVGEFAWNVTEPEEGDFTFDFWDKFLDLCSEYGMNVIMGTPTATPPAWLTEKYPEVLTGTAEGVLYRHGARRHYNYNSPKYNELSARIVDKLAGRYGRHSAIIGWQIDNELNCEVSEFYSQADDAAFKIFLQKKYGTIDELNRAWGTTFWNQGYNDFTQIHIPQPVLNEGKNPHRYLDYYRFVSESTVAYCKMQADIIHKYVPENVFVMTNGLFWNVDNHEMMDECLDIYTYDSYPGFAFTLDRDPNRSEDLLDRHWSKNLSETRSVCPHFGIMEQQSGALGWATRMESPAPRPGKINLWALQSVAHGADMVSFFRWRTCTAGTEMYWHGILDYDNRDNRKLREVKQFYQNLQNIGEVCGADHIAQLGIVKDYDNLWDTNTDVWHRRVNDRSDEAIFEEVQLAHVGYDYVYINDDTSADDIMGYKVLIYAHPVIMSEKRAKLLREYVAGGGTLIIGCRAGYKDMDGHCVMMPGPGLLAELTGSDVMDFTFTSAREPDVIANFNGYHLTMPLFNDILCVKEGEDTENTRILARYENNYYEGQAAVIAKTTGKGQTIHFGSTFDRSSVKALLEYTGIAEPYSDIMEVPEEVEIVARIKNGVKYFFLLNYTDSRQLLIIKTPMVNLINGEEVAGAYILNPNTAAVMKPE